MNIGRSLKPMGNDVTLLWDGQWGIVEMEYRWSALPSDHPGVGSRMKRRHARVAAVLVFVVVALCGLILVMTDQNSVVGWLMVSSSMAWLYWTQRSRPS